MYNAYTCAKSLQHELHGSALLLLLLLLTSLDSFLM
jgi:hypothetical protein